MKDYVDTEILTAGEREFLIRVVYQMFIENIHNSFMQPICCGVVWCGVVWCGVLWCGVVWR